MELTQTGDFLENVTDVDYVTEFIVSSTSSSWSTTRPLTNSSGGIPFRHRLAVACCCCVITIVGLLGNSLVVVSVIVSKKLRTTTNILVVNLAIADFLSCLILPFMVVGLVNRSASGEYPLPEIICAIATGVIFVCAGVSVSTLSTIAFVRWYVITKSIRGHRGIHTPRNLLVIVIILWVISISCVAVPLVFGVGEIGYSKYYSLCSVTDTNPLRGIFVLLQSAFILVNIIITGVFYAMIVIHVMRQTRQFRKKFADDTSQQNAQNKDQTNLNAAFIKREVAITKNLFTVVCIFVLCYLPNAVNFFIPGTSVLTLYGAMISMANSCLNPIIYGLKHPNFQGVFKNLILCRQTSSLESSISNSKSHTHSTVL